MEARQRGKEVREGWKGKRNDVKESGKKERKEGRKEGR